MSTSPLRILIIGDVVGKPGRVALKTVLPELRAREKLDLVIANVENLAHGKGVTQKTLDEVFAAGVDACTSGNHILNKEGPALLANTAIPLVRPANFPEGTPGRGWMTVTVNGCRVLIINLIGTTFFRDGSSYANPFNTIDDILKQPEAEEADVILLDWHTEATSEKIAMGWHLDGRVAGVFGTHTHVASDDLRILPRGTAYRSDLGMTGLRDEVLGAEKGIILHNFLHPENGKAHMWTDEGPLQLHGVIVDVDQESGLAIAVRKIDHELRA